MDFYHGQILIEMETDSLVQNVSTLSENRMNLVKKLNREMSLLSLNLPTGQGGGFLSQNVKSLSLRAYNVQDRLDL